MSRNGEHELTLLALELLASGIDPTSAVERARNIAALLGKKPDESPTGSTATTHTHAIGPPPWKMPIDHRPWGQTDEEWQWINAAWEALGRP